MAITFQEHMRDRASMFNRCTKVKIGKDFAVFTFETTYDLTKAVDFADSCNKMYKYTFDSNQTDKLVCFNTK